MSDINFLINKAFRDRINENYGKQINIDRERMKQLNFARMYDSKRLEKDNKELAKALSEKFDKIVEKGKPYIPKRPFFDLPRKTFKHKASNIDEGSEERTVIKLVIPYASLTGRNDIAPTHVYVNAMENLFRKINHLIIRTHKDMMNNEKIIILNAPENYQDSLNFNMLLNYLKEYELKEI